MKKSRKKFLSIVKFLISFPVFWITLLILLLSAAALIFSILFHKANEGYLSSIFSDVFTGLITGLVLAILSGVKTVYCSYMEARLLWLEETHKMILDHINDEHKLWVANKESDEFFFNLAYDVGSKANWVNERIMQSNFDKVKWFNPEKYFRKNYNYDCMKVHKISQELRDYIIENGECHETRKDVINEIRKISSIMMTLNHDILSDMDSIKIKLAGAKKSII